MYGLKSSTTSIARRGFLKAAASISGLISASLFAPSLFADATEKNGLTDPVEVPLKLRKSIQANFGSGFHVLSSQVKSGKTYALIEHLENRYTVVSADMHRWEIIESTEI